MSLGDRMFADALYHSAVARELRRAADKQLPKIRESLTRAATSHERRVRMIADRAIGG